MTVFVSALPTHPSSQTMRKMLEELFRECLNATPKIIRKNFVEQVLVEEGRLLNWVVFILVLRTYWSATLTYLFLGN